MLEPLETVDLWSGNDWQQLINIICSNRKIQQKSIWENIRTPLWNCGRITAERSA